MFGIGYVFLIEKVKDSGINAEDSLNEIDYLVDFSLLIAVGLVTDRIHKYDLSFKLYTRSQSKHHNSDIKSRILHILPVNSSCSMPSPS